MPTPSIKETISAHDEGEDLPRMDGEASIYKALREAATSLETIGRLAGLGEFMLEDSEVRAYANSRAGVARAALSAAPQSDGWRPIATAPKSRDCGQGRIEGAYLLGFCPSADMCNLESAVCVVWWEPLMKKGAGMWYGEGGYETHPTHWMPLPTPPKMTQTEGQNHGQ